MKGTDASAEEGDGEGGGEERHRSVPSPSALFRYLEAFHDPGEERKREPGRAFIPAVHEHLQGLRRANQDFMVSIQKTPSGAGGYFGYGCHARRDPKEGCLV